MGSCPVCGAVIFSPAAAAGRLGVSVQRVRAILGRNPSRLQAFKIGAGWAIPAAAVAAFERGQVLGLDRRPALPVCLGCGMRLYSAVAAAAVLGVSLRRVYAILSDWPGRLSEFKIGRRVVIPQIGIDVYRESDYRRDRPAKEIDIISEPAEQSAGQDFADVGPPVVVDDSSLLWTTPQFSAVLARRGHAVAMRTIQRWCQSGRLPAVRRGRDWLIPGDAALEWLERQGMLK